MRLGGKVAIVTGASSGIGAATSKLFAAEGARVILAARRAVALDAIVEQLDALAGEAIAVPGDVIDEAYARRLVDVAVSEFGGLDIAFNNAGALGPRTELPAMALADWNQVIQTNLTAAFLGAKHQIPAMRARGGGSLLFTSSFVGHTIGLPGMGAYAASKAGLIGLVQCLAVEHGADAIRVNAVLPGGTRTPMAGDFSAHPELEDVIASFHALKRLAEPEEIARAALFLASDESSFVTGSAMLADGGNSITKV